MPTTTQGVLLPRLDGDGKAVILDNPAFPGWKPWITSAGDLMGPPIVRGGGNALLLAWTLLDGANITKSVNISFAEPVELHDGGVLFNLTGWVLEDKLNFRVILPSTEVTANGGGTGNCNLVPTGLGFNAVVPAPGNGAYDVVLASAVPVPSTEATGYWDVDYNTGVITASATPGAAPYNLFTAEISNWFRDSYFFNVAGQLALPAYGVQWIHPKWIIRFSATKAVAADAKIVGWIRCFRRNTQV